MTYDNYLTDHTIIAIGVAIILGLALLVVCGPGMPWSIFRRKRNGPPQMIRVARVASGRTNVFVRTPITAHSGWQATDIEPMQVRTVEDAQRVRIRANKGKVVTYELIGDVDRDALDLLDPDFVEPA